MSNFCYSSLFCERSIPVLKVTQPCRIWNCLAAKNLNMTLCCAVSSARGNFIHKMVNTMAEAIKVSTYDMNWLKLLKLFIRTHSNVLSPPCLYLVCTVVYHLGTIYASQVVSGVSRANGPLNMQTLDIMISQKISTFWLPHDWFLLLYYCSCKWCWWCRTVV